MLEGMDVLQTLLFTTYIEIDETSKSGKAISSDSFSYNSVNRLKGQRAHIIMHFVFVTVVQVKTIRKKLPCAVVLEDTMSWKTKVVNNNNRCAKMP